MVTALCFVACSRTQKKFKTENLEWLNGNWINNSDSNLVITENWQTINDTLMLGESFTIDKGDTVSHERMQIKILDNNVLFIPVVSNQNNGKPVVFTLTDFKNNTLVFKNPEHDFPQEIVYQKITDDSVYAYIGGTMNGKTQRIDFGYRRK